MSSDDLDPKMKLCADCLQSLAGNTFLAGGLGPLIAAVYGPEVSRSFGPLAFMGMFAAWTALAFLMLFCATRLIQPVTVSSP